MGSSPSMSIKSSSGVIVTSLAVTSLAVTAIVQGSATGQGSAACGGGGGGRACNSRLGCGTGGDDSSRSCGAGDGAGGGAGDGAGVGAGFSAGECARDSIVSSDETARITDASLGLAIVQS